MNDKQYRLDDPTEDEIQALVDTVIEKDARIAELEKERDKANERYDKKCNEYLFDMMEKAKRILELEASLRLADTHDE